MSAYRHSGKGSTSARAREIKVIYDSAAPEINPVMNSAKQEFLREVRHLVREAIEQGGGELVIKT
jgi:hypothetical protein